MIRINILKTKKAVLLAFTLLMAGASGASLAGPIVTSWDYVNTAIFTDAKFTDFENIYGSETKKEYELSWGAIGGSFIDPPDIVGRSALTIGSGTLGTIMEGGPASGTIDTVIGDGPPTASDIGIGINISHWNNRIWSGYDELLSGTLRDSVNFKPTIGGPPAEIFPLLFDFVFLETTNIGECPDGTIGTEDDLCGDLLGISKLATLNPGFKYDGHNYRANIIITDGMGGTAPVGTLDNGECDALGLDVGCRGWVTTENDITTLQFGFFITVPEPSTLALFGLGLAGLGYRRYKARAA